MSEEHKHIDQLFRESLKGYREKPPIYAWDRLKDDLLQKRRSRMFLILRWSSAAAAIVIAFIAGYYIANYNATQQVTDNNTTVPLQEEGKLINDDIATANVVIEDQENNDDLQFDNSNEDAMATTPSSIINQEIAITKNNSINQEDDSQVIAEIIKANEPEILPSNSDQLSENEADEVVQDITDIIAEDEEIVSSVINITDENEPTAETEEIILENTIPAKDLSKEIAVFDDLSNNKIKTNTNWKLGGKFAPVYSYRSISIAPEDLPDNVIPNESHYNDTENPLYSFSSGMDVAYQSDSRWGFQTGVFYSRLGQVIEDVIAYRSPGNEHELFISTSTGAINLDARELENTIDQGEIREDSTGNILYINSDIYQHFSYIEVPLILNYSLLNSRFGIQLSGGLSPGFMVDNAAFFQLDDENITLDRTEEFYSLIYNSVVGVGLKYDISKQLHINLSPTFKYSLRSIRKDHSIEYHPYSVSLFTGISYTF